MTKILLIRHGQSTANEQGIFGGTTDYPLSEKGHTQAKQLAMKLENMNIDVIYSSSLKRAIQTAQPIAEILQKEIKIEDDLREIHVGAWEGTLCEDFYKQHPKIDETQYYTGIEGQEETEDVAKRMLNIMTKIAKENEGKTVAIASHVQAIRAFLCTIMHIPFELIHEKIGDLPNTNITTLNYENATDKFEVVQLRNECA